MLKLEWLEETWKDVLDTIKKYNGTMHYGPNNITKTIFFVGDYVFLFPKAKKIHIGKFKKLYFGTCQIQYYLPNNTTLLVEGKFDPNLISVIVNKLKHCWNLELILNGLEVWLEAGKEGKIKVSHLMKFKFKNSNKLDLDINLEKPQLKIDKTQLKLWIIDPITTIN
jgi:hypothetical protein